jgi:predicted HicB family RNase H-like nuclease
MPTSKPKPKKPERPRLAKAVTKGSIMPVRFSTEIRKRIESAAKTSNKAVSEWIRSTLAAALKV